MPKRDGVFPARPPSLDSLPIVPGPRSVSTLELSLVAGRRDCVKIFRVMRTSTVVSCVQGTGVVNEGVLNKGVLANYAALAGS